ncbi:MAG: hypothetical protein IJQ58_10010 [Synergistaceae bacterium]|nr:hypothetical protein [Synergistaceae bacterium]
MTLEREAELRDAIEQGRRYRIAAEVFAEFLSDCKEEIIRGFEAYGTNVSDKDAKITELMVLRKFRDVSAKMMVLGEQAERELESNGN